MSDTTERIAELTQERAEASKRANWLDLQWRGMIQTAVRMGQPVAEIAEAAGISRQRVYQIRDGKR